MFLIFKCRRRGDYKLIFTKLMNFVVFRTVSAEPLAPSDEEDEDEEKVWLTSPILTRQLIKSQHFQNNPK